MRWWLALCLCVFQSAMAATVDRIAAIVNDDVIALSEVYELGDAFIRQSCPRMQDTCVDRAEADVVESLIQARLVRQELYKLGLQVTAEEIDRTIDQISRENGLADRVALREEVERAGMTWEAYREQLTEQLRQLKFNESVIRPRIQVREDEVQERYRRATRDYQGPPVATVEALALALPEDRTPEDLVMAVTRASEIAASVRSGEVEWKAAVAEHDSGLYAPRDGEMGSFRQGELMTSLDEVVFSLELEQISEPVLVGNAVFLVKVTELRESDVLSYDEAAPRIREQLYQEKVEREVEEWTAAARKKAAIRVLVGPPEVPAPADESSTGLP